MHKNVQNDHARLDVNRRYDHKLYTYVHTNKPHKYTETSNLSPRVLPQS